MLKMLLDPMGGIVLTNDGHAILREIEVAHPAAKSMIELSRTQVWPFSLLYWLLLLLQVPGVTGTLRSVQ